MSVRARSRASMPGPSRRITVEPLTVPAPPQPAPPVSPPQIEPDERPEPVRDPIPTP
ncbi:MAG TPA: hypothetical protein VH834_20865 [Solirubrobacteraceae bacterium]